MASSWQPTRQPGIGISFEAVEKRYGTVRALRPTTLTISPGEFVVLLGPNGSGKSTLLRLAALLARPTAGRISYTGAAAAETQEAARRRLGVVAHATLLYDDLTAEENLRLFAQLYGVAEAAMVVGEQLKSVGLSDRSGDLVRTFSRGMRQRLTLARALLHGPGLLLFDEPATGLDAESSAWLGRELHALHGSGCTIVMSTHHGGEVLGLATRALHLESGRVVEDSAAPAGAGKPGAAAPGAGVLGKSE
jgi:ABC-type multidrug transport system ATPase subunit